MAKYIKVDIPQNKPKESLELSDSIILKNTAEGAGSSLAGVSTKASYSISDLTNGPMYFFRVACITSAWLGPWSDAVSCRVL